MRKNERPERRERREKLYYLTADGRVISSFDVANAVFIMSGQKVSPFDRKVLDVIVGGFSGIVKELDETEANDIVDDNVSRGKHGTMRIN